MIIFVLLYLIGMVVGGFFYYIGRVQNKKLRTRMILLGPVFTFLLVGGVVCWLFAIAFTAISDWLFGDGAFKDERLTAQEAGGV